MRSGGLSANGAAIITAWGNAPGMSPENRSALKARFKMKGRIVFDSRFQRSLFGKTICLGRCPRL
jgi:hypothetical protein